MGNGIELRVPENVSDDELRDFLDTTLKGLTSSPSDDAGQPSQTSGTDWNKRLGAAIGMPGGIFDFGNPVTGIGGGKKLEDVPAGLKSSFINVGLFALGAVIFVAAIWLPLSRSTVAVDFAKGVVEGATEA